MTQRIGLPDSFVSLVNGILVLISSLERFTMTIATFISELEAKSNECLSIEDYMKITGLSSEIVEEHLGILCEAQILKPVKSKLYGITDFGCDVLKILGITENSIKPYIS